jgi:hypothetical protein
MRLLRPGSVSLVGLAAAFVVGTATPASAQEKGKIGLTMGYPAAVGLLFHVTDKVAIRPEVSFATSSTEIEGGLITGSSDAFTIGTGVSALFYLQAWDDVRVYVSPRWTYSHGSSSSSFSGLGPIEDSDDSTNTWSLGGSFGAQYGLGKRFGVFGEIGIAYSQSRLSDETVIDFATKGSGFGSRAGVGVIVYF